MNLINKILIGLIALLVFLPMAMSAPQLTGNVILPNGGEYLSGTFNIKYAWNSANAEYATKVIGGLSYFDPTKSDPATIIASDLNLLNQANCLDSDNKQETPQDCTYVWDTKTAADGRYLLRLTIFYFDQADMWHALEDVSNGTFIVDNTKPNAITNLTATVLDSNRVELNWSAVQDTGSGLKNYYIYKSESEITTANFKTYQVAQTNTLTNYVDTTVTNGKTYYYRVTSIDNSGNESDLSNQTSATINTADITKPSKTTDLTLNATADYFELNWSDSTDASGIDYYKVYKSESEINSDNYANAFLTKATTSYYKDNAVAVGKTYYYRVTAVDKAANESELSNIVSGKIPAPYGTTLIEIIPTDEQINMGSNATATIVFGLKNKTPDKQCMTFSTEDNTSYIKETLTDQEMCLSGNAQTTVSMNIITEYAQLSVYEVKFKLKIDSTYEDFAVVKVTVGQTASVDIISTSGQQICKGNTENISFKVVNTTNEVKTIKLHATNEMFMPVLSDNEIELDAKEEQVVNVKIYTNSSTAFGYRTIKIVGNIGAEHTEEDLSFNVVDCSSQNNTNVNFKIIADTNSCFNVDKDKDSNINFQVKNLTSGKITVNLQTFSAIETNVVKSITIEANAIAELKLLVKPKLSDAVGTQNIEIYGWNGTYNTKQTLCVKVLTKAKSDVELKNNNLVIERKKQGIYVLLIRNLGDTTQNYEVNVNAPYSNIVTSISDINFKLESKKEKEVFIAVSPTKDAALGDYNITAVIKDENTEAFDLKFKVIEETQMALEFYAFPSNVYINQNKDTVVTITVANESNTDLEKVKVYLKGLPKGVYAPSFEDTIVKGKTKEFKMKISVDKDVEPDLYQLKLIAEKDNEKVEETVWLKVKPENADMQADVKVDKKDDDLLSGISGFVGFASSFTLGAILVALVIILAVLLFYVRKKKGSESDDY